MSETSNSVVLSYYDCLLRQDDVSLLKGPYWLNDAIIGFYFEYLSNELDKESSQDILLISPELTQLLKLTDVSSYPVFLDPLNAKKKNFIFFPLNDCEHKDAAGGSHWSLLLFSQPEKTCFHFDSLSNGNKNTAKTFSNSIMNYFLDQQEGTFVNVNCSQQENSYDCGVYVLCFVDIILKQIIQFSKFEGCDCNSITELVSNKREELLSLIERLANKNK